MAWRRRMPAAFLIKGIAVLVPLPSGRSCMRGDVSLQNEKGEPPALRAGVPGYKAIREDRRLFFHSCILAETGGLTI